jgi:adenosylcobinamide-GDP ribazoletransferase
MREFFDGFILSISFFTKLPTPYHVKKTTDDVYKYFTLSIPLNGLILGLISILFYDLLSTHAEKVYVAVLTSVVYLFLYGFLHLEAVADIVDAYHGSHGGKNAHDILKDPHVGAIGAIATFSLVIVKVASFSYLLLQEDYLSILAVLYISRLMAVFAIYRFEFHKDSKFIQKLKEPVTDISILLLLIFSLLVLAILKQVLLLFVAFVITFLLYKWLIKNIGFLNGDGLGFMIEIDELLLLNLLIFIIKYNNS